MLADAMIAGRARRSVGPAVSRAVAARAGRAVEDGVGGERGVVEIGLPRRHADPHRRRPVPLGRTAPDAAVGLDLGDQRLGRRPVDQPDEHLVQDDVVQDGQPARLAAARRSPRRRRRPASTSVGDARRGRACAARTTPRPGRARCDDWGVWCMASNSPLGREVAGHGGEGAPEVGQPADEGDAAVVGDVEPLVAVGGPRVGPVEPSHEVGAARVGERPQPEGAVDVQPARRARPASRRSRRTGRRRRVFTSPACAHTSTGPSRSGQQLGPHPALVVGGHDGDPVRGPRPTRPSDFDSVEWACSPTTTDRRRRAEQARRPARPSRARPSSASRAAARHDALATVAPLTKATPVSAGRRRRSTSQRRTTSWSFAATGDITGSAAFWSHALTSQELPSATG